ncbi:hypothetical protein RMCBS344292_03516 [Rhizopus microsporus]|nr:hypothetical protein RMCBS344292_03516 [Rhizopus microsporus]
MSDPFKREDSSDDDQWRDPHIGETPTPSTRFSNTFDDNSTLVSGRSSRASTAMEPFTSTRPAGSPDDYWVLPPHCTLTDILGTGRTRLKEMARSTGAYMTYNDALHQIDLWGDSLCIDKAKHSLNMIANRIAELDVTLLRKTKKWSRPDRELTNEEKRREEKRQQRILEEKKYLGEPTEKLPYYSVYYSPSDAVSINRIVGNNDSYLNQIRIDCKTYIEYDAQNHIFRLYSNDEANIKAASARLRNWHLRCCREPEAGVARLMQQPSANLALKYRKLPPDFVLYDYVPPDREQELRDRLRMFETITTGFEANIAYWNASMEDSLISLNDSQQMRGALSERAKTLDKRNEEVQFARSLPYDDVNAPHEKFSKNLKLSPSGRLIMAPVFDYNPKIVKQKTKWRYSWHDFTIEICQEELWDLDEIKRKDTTLPLDFSKFKPHHKQFKVSMYKEQWVDRFAENLRLRVGEAPSWTIRDFLGTEEENVHTIVQNVKEFGQILASVVPVYFEQSAASLV